jgi:molecular chaperone HtpG
VLISKSITTAKPIKWVGKSDGSYTISSLEADYEPGTRVYLTAKSDAEQFFTYGVLKELVIRYANFLPYPIHLIVEQHPLEQVNEWCFPGRKLYYRYRKERCATQLRK